MESMKEIMKGEKLGRQGGTSSQEQPRMEIMKGDTFGRGGGSSISHWSKNPYSFQLSGEQFQS